jgi:hypothetical protein
MAESQMTSSKGLRAEDCFSKELRALGLNTVKETGNLEGCELRG